jgi:CTP:molybdopterin cytidylyltransferase MocA
MSSHQQTIAAVILAAGASTRLGRPKQTVVLAGETLIDRAARIATEAGLSPVIAVVADAALIDPLQTIGADVLLNRKSYEGMSTSIVCGVQWASSIGIQGVVLMTCDQIAVTADHLRSLTAHPSKRTGSAYAGKIGVPAYFPSSDFPALLALQGDTGARDLLRSARSIPTEALAFDIDTEADLARAQAFLKS